MTIPGKDPADDRYKEPWRDRVAADLLGYQVEQQELWGGIDELTLARYEAGTLPDAERARVEQAMREHPALRECMEIARGLSPERQADTSPPLAEKLGEPGQVPPDLPAFDPAAIRIDPGDHSTHIPRRHPPKPVLRWLAIAAAVAAIVGIGLAYHYAWRKAAPGVPPEIVGKPPAKKPGTVVVDQGKGATKNTLPPFKDALAALEKRASAGIDPKELRRAYDQLLKDYPGHKAEIESDETLASALARPDAIAKKPDDTPPSPVESARDALLARIAGYAGKPLAVSDAKVRGLREEVVRYQKEHPEPKIPEMEAFAAAAEPTPQKELLYAEARAKELRDSPKESAEVRELRSTILTLRLRDDTRPLVLQSKPLVAFMDHTRTDDPAAKAADLKTGVLALADRFPKAKERGPYLLCVLPVGIRTEAVELYTGIQAYARSLGTLLPEASLLDYVTRARRPVVQDSLGMIIPMYIYPDPNNPGPWNQVLALGHQGMRIKVVINPNLDNAQAADPNYVAVIDRLHQQGIEVLGRVSCQGGANGPNLAQNQVMVWHQFYANRLDGLFFGDQATDIALVKPYAALYRYARGLENQWQVVACPGSPCDEAFLTQTGADILCPSSNNGGPYTQGWEAKYDPEHFAALINEVSDATLVPGFLMTAVEKHFGWVFVGGPDPFKVMPPFLGMELGWIQDMNALILNGNDPVPVRRAIPKAPAKSKTRR